MKIFKDTKPFMYSDYSEKGFIEYRFMGTLSRDIRADFQVTRVTRQETAYIIPKGTEVICTLRDWVKLPGGEVKTTLLIEQTIEGTIYSKAFIEDKHVDGAVRCWGNFKYKIA